MNTFHCVLTVIGAVIAAACPGANAGLGDRREGVFSPFDNAEVTIEWVGSRAGFRGELAWDDPDIWTTPVMLFYNKVAHAGERVVLPVMFDAGQEVALSYRTVTGIRDVFSITTPGDRAQFRVDDLDPLAVLVGIEDIRLPGGDRDFNDVQVRVLFAALPGPSGLGVLGAGLLLTGLRRR